jgi:putative transposase
MENRIQFAWTTGKMNSEKFTLFANEQGNILLFIRPSRPNQNAFVERFNRSFKEELMNANLFN